MCNTWSTANTIVMEISPEKSFVVRNIPEKLFLGKIWKKVVFAGKLVNIQFCMENVFKNHVWREGTKLNHYTWKE